MPTDTPSLADSGVLLETAKSVAEAGGLKLTPVLHGVASKQPGFINREDTETSVHTKDGRVA